MVGALELTNFPLLEPLDIVLGLELSPLALSHWLVQPGLGVGGLGRGPLRSILLGWLVWGVDPFGLGPMSGLHLDILK